MEHTDSESCVYCESCNASMQALTCTRTHTHTPLSVYADLRILLFCLYSGLCYLKETIFVLFKKFGLIIENIGRNAVW